MKRDKLDVNVVMSTLLYKIYPRCEIWLTPRLLLGGK